MKERYRLALIMSMVPWLFLSFFGMQLHATGVLPLSAVITVLASQVLQLVGSAALWRRRLLGRTLLITYACVYLSGLVLIAVADDVNVSMVATEPEARRRGLATAVMRASLLDARQPSLQRVDVPGSDPHGFGSAKVEQD